jgi:MFS family permease
LIQGGFAGLMVPQSITLMMGNVTQEQRGRAMRLWGAVSGLASIVGPLIGGLLIQAGGWHWVFTINIPIAILVVVLSDMFISEIDKRHAMPIDVVPLIAGFAFVSLAMFVLLDAPGRGVSAVTLSAAIALCALAVVFAHARRHRSDSCTIPLFIRRDRQFIGASFSGFFVGLVVFAVTYIASTYAQTGLGMSAVQSGLLLLLPSAFSVVLSPLSGRLTDEGRGRQAIGIGYALTICSLLLMLAATKAPASAWCLIAGLGVFGIGNGLLVSPLTTVAMESVRDASKVSSASSLLNLLRQDGSVFSGGALGLVAGMASGSSPASLNSALLLVPLAAAVLGVLLSAWRHAGSSVQTLDVI